MRAYIGGGSRRELENQLEKPIYGRSTIAMNGTANALKYQESCFDYCKSCGQLMRTIDNQIHLMTACPEWDAKTVEDVRKTLKSVGVHDSYEVKPGLCERCSTRRPNEEIFEQPK